MSRFINFALLCLSLVMAMGCEPRTAEDCDTDLSEMREVIADAVEEGSWCDTDSDCAIIDPSTACEARCPTAVNVEAVDQTLSAINDAELSFCMGYGEDCGYIAVSCEARYPVCNAGRCEMVSY